MTSTNIGSILITGAAGYIGGSIVSDFLGGIVPSLKGRKIVAAVRSQEQAASLSESGVNVICLDIADKKAVTKALVDNNIFIVIHTASSLIPELAINLIDGLSEQRKQTGRKTYFIHTSAMSAFMPRTGWPSGKLQGPGHEIFETEKQLADSYPVRKTDVTVVEHAQAQGVISFIVIPCLTYGKGTGAWNKLSVNIPIIINASIEHKKVQQFAENIEVSYVHISDLTALYGLLVERILQDEEPPNGTDGFYFSTAYQISSHDFSEHLARALHTRGLVASSTPEVWPSVEAAAEGLSVPVKFVEYLWNSGDEAPSVGKGGAHAIGWQPKWSREKFLRNIDDEIDAVLELGKAKSSLIASLFTAAKE
ncbi:NAD(P)-binding protein [Karstenula rhodostoma CBS 690.94]|uniref:NAD(P)-binding protein n=1 Tax=Karstenula rhodostoma CBS 690.94 TaxID=1392251 RepID=A0A9P4PQP0_9PLEO|nr:NAD(P)-binding protein [Karstenula rhodostoma CBS 690.94]